MIRKKSVERALFQIGGSHQVQLRLMVLFLLTGLLAAAVGCTKPPPPGQPIHVRPEVHLVKPERKTIVRTTGQPGFIEAYEQTSLYPNKVAGYIAPWNGGRKGKPTSDDQADEKVKDQRPDIGTRITRGEILVHINVPDLEAEYRAKQAQAALDIVQIQVAEELVNVAEENVKTATAQVAEAKANVAKFEADVERWESEVKRLGSVGDAINQQIVSESRKQLKVSTAARSAAEATAMASEAMEAARKAEVKKARVDVEAARGRAKVTEEDVQRLAALVSYADIRAPYDGIVLVRNVVTGDYVQPNTGDASGARSLQDKGGQTSTPLYVVARTDIVRIFLDVSEMEANGVGPGSPATVRIQAVDNEEIAGTVTRMSGGLQDRTRTLRVEVDLKNPGGRILPGMYAYGQVEVKRPNVWTVPLKTVTMIGNQNCCYVFDNGKVAQLQVQTGIDDGKSVEVTMKRSNGKWIPFDGSEQVVDGDLSELSNGQAVRVATGPEMKE
jgi:multidrug resistance efflux pump